MTHAQLIRSLKSQCAESTLRAVATRLGITASYLSDTINGRRDPGPKLLTGLGLSRRVTYHRLTDGRSSTAD